MFKRKKTSYLDRKQYFMELPATLEGKLKLREEHKGLIEKLNFLMIATAIGYHFKGQYNLQSLAILITPFLILYISNLIKYVRAVDEYTLRKAEEEQELIESKQTL